MNKMKKNIEKLSEIGETLLIQNVKRCLEKIDSTNEFIKIVTFAQKIFKDKSNILYGEEFSLVKSKIDIKNAKLKYEIFSKLCKDSNLDIRNLQDKYTGIMEEYNFN